MYVLISLTHNAWATRHGHPASTDRYCTYRLLHVYNTISSFLVVLPNNYVVNNGIPNPLFYLWTQLYLVYMYAQENHKMCSLLQLYVIPCYNASNIQITKWLTCISYCKCMYMYMNIKCTHTIHVHVPVIELQCVDSSPTCIQKVIHIHIQCTQENVLRNKNFKIVTLTTT